jgi:hypothetical protein
LKTDGFRILRVQADPLARSVETANTDEIST